MKFRSKFLILFCLLNLNTIEGSASWYDQKLEGWYYFEEHKHNENEELSPEEAEEIIEDSKRGLKQLLSLAILSPSTENVQQYITQQKRWLDQSAHFADSWGKVLLEHPILGDFLTSPTTNYGILAKRDLDLKKRKLLLENLSKTHFILFFFRGKDFFSEKVAEVVKLFGEINHWKIKAVSLDGYGTKDFQTFDLDKGISENLKIQLIPSLFVVNPFENTILPIGAGLVSVSEIEQNIENQLGGEKNR